MCDDDHHLVLCVFDSKQIWAGASPNCFSQNEIHPYLPSLTLLHNMDMELLYVRWVDSTIGGF